MPHGCKRYISSIVNPFSKCLAEDTTYGDRAQSQQEPSEMKTQRKGELACFHAKFKEVDSLGEE
jgi:hypothetical protein